MAKTSSRLHPSGDATQTKCPGVEASITIFVFLCQNWESAHHSCGSIFTPGLWIKAVG